MYRKEYIDFYGFLGIGQFGGNVTRKFEEANYPCVVANSSIEDLATRDAKNKLHFRNGHGCHKNRKKSKALLKENLEELAEELGLSIPNLSETRSRRSYNKYVIQYEPLYLPADAAIQSGVMLETSFAEISFPVVTMDVHSIVGDMLADEAPEILSAYSLQPFSMKVQSLERTLVDKLFAICDYYLSGREIDKHSRHLYDIYKLLPLVKLDDRFRQLVLDVRKERAKNTICLSAKDGVDLSALLRKIIAEDAYKYGYNHLTVRLLDEEVRYEEAVSALEKIVQSNVL